MEVLEVNKWRSESNGIFILYENLVWLLPGFCRLDFIELLNAVLQGRYFAHLSLHLRSNQTKTALHRGGLAMEKIYQNVNSWEHA